MKIIKNTKSLKEYITKGIIFVSILGTLFHFLYEWSNKNIFIGIFTPVNESIWEHTKLIFSPMLIYALFANKKISKKYPHINKAMILGEMLGILLIIVLFYTYSGIIGFNFAFADISIFYISVVLAFYIVYKSASSQKENSHDTLFKILQIVIIFLYILFTFCPPSISLFSTP